MNGLPSTISELTPGNPTALARYSLLFNRICDATVVDAHQYAFACHHAGSAFHIA